MCNITHSTGHQLRSCDQGFLKVPRTNFKTFGDCPYAHSGPFLWNELTLEIRNSPSVTNLVKAKDTSFQAGLQIVLIFLTFLSFEYL